MAGERGHAPADDDPMAKQLACIFMNASDHDLLLHATDASDWRFA